MVRRRAIAGAACVHLAAMRAVSSHGSEFGLAAILRDALASLGLLGLRSRGKWLRSGSRADKNRASPTSAPKQPDPPLGVAQGMPRTRRLARCIALLSYSFANNFAKVIPTHGAHVAQRHINDVRAGKGRNLRRNAMINWSSLVASVSRAHPGGVTTCMRA